MFKGILWGVTLVIFGSGMWAMWNAQHRAEQIHTKVRELRAEMVKAQKEYDETLAEWEAKGEVLPELNKLGRLWRQALDEAVDPDLLRGQSIGTYSCIKEPTECRNAIAEVGILQRRLIRLLEARRRLQNELATLIQIRNKAAEKSPFGLPEE